MSTLKVDKIENTATTNGGIEIDNTGHVQIDGVQLPTAGAFSNRNLIINGAMQIAQRGTSSTTNESFVVDRFENQFNATDEAPTFEQVDVASGTTPFEQGFRKALKITNGNQSSGAGGSDMVAIVYNFEAQDLACSGWNYVSSSSYVTLSYWVKSSVAQNFYGRLRSFDNTDLNYTFETGSLTADTWTKITKTIPGHSSLAFDNDVNTGMFIELSAFRGTDKTGSMDLNTWDDFDTNVRTPDQTSTWYTTDNATFEITGVQLEVGEKATPFEHRSYGDELVRCQRYFRKYAGGIFTPGGTTATLYGCLTLEPPMRTGPSLDVTGTITVTAPTVSSNTQTSADISVAGHANAHGVFMSMANFSSLTNHRPYIYNDGTDFITLSAEL